MRHSNVKRPFRKVLPVEWHECHWQPLIKTGAWLRLVSLTAIKPLPAPAFLPHPVRRKNLFKPMKKNLILTRPYRAGFTLVELLTVIAIIAILAAMLLPVLSSVKKHALIARAKIEVNDIATAVQAYDSAYGRFPVSTNAQDAAIKNQTPNGIQHGDYTYGGNNFTNESVQTSIPAVGNFNYITNNSEVIAILMDITNYPATGLPTVDDGHVKNPQQRQFLNARFASDTSSPGVGKDLVYRDPWGNPYIISMDLNYDGQCEDWLYRNVAVSYISGTDNAGYNGLANPNFHVDPNEFQFHGPVMVWSVGPDGKFSSSKPANQGFNKDNILSWQQ